MKPLALNLTVAECEQRAWIEQDDRYKQLAHKAQRDWQGSRSVVFANMQVEFKERERGLT